MPGVSEEALLAMMQASIVPLSLNSSSTRDGDKDELQDIIADPRGNNPLENLIQENLKYKLRQALNLLPEEQRSALSYRFGISNSGEECPSLREPEISAVMGISLERVRRLIDKGLESLKRLPVVESLNAV
jgi:DNA-directed RNA polymerase sigma subunit (sigma70/sigma32)